MNNTQAKEWFAYQDANDEQTQACVNVRVFFSATAEKVCEFVPEGPDRTYTLRKLKDALQAAIGGIVAPIPR